MDSLFCFLNIWGCFVADIVAPKGKKFAAACFNEYFSEVSKIITQIFLNI